jgi:hypothetical protein
LRETISVVDDGRIEKRKLPKFLGERPGVFCAGTASIGDEDRT